MPKAIRAFIAVGLAVTLAGCWEQPGFDAGRSNWNTGETTLTAANVGGLARLWAVVPFDSGGGVNPPISSGGRLYVTAVDQPVVVAMDAGTGAVVWTRDLTKVGFDRQLVGPPTLFHGELIVPYGEQWADVSDPRMPKELSRGGFLHLDPDDGSSVSEDLTNGDVGRLASVANDQLVLWRDLYDDLGNRVGSTIDGTYTALVDFGVLDFAVVGDRFVVMQSSRTSALGYSPACPPPASACAPDWSTDLGFQNLPGPVAVGNDKVAVAHDEPSPSGFARLSVLDAATGQVQWYWRSNPADILGKPAVADGKILMTAGHDTDERLYAFPSQGCGAPPCAPVWSGALGRQAFAQPPVVANHLVYTSTFDNDLKVFSLDGCGQADCPPVATIPDTGQVTLVNDGRVILIRGNELLAYGLPG